MSRGRLFGSILGEVIVSSQSVVADVYGNDEYRHMMDAELLDAYAKNCEQQPRTYQEKCTLEALRRQLVIAIELRGLSVPV